MAHKDANNKQYCNWKYLDISIDFSHSVLIVGDFNIPEFAHF